MRTYSEPVRTVLGWMPSGPEDPERLTVRVDESLMIDNVTMELPAIGRSPHISPDFTSYFIGPVAGSQVEFWTQFQFTNLQTAGGDRCAINLEIYKRIGIRNLGINRATLQLFGLLVELGVHSRTDRRELEKEFILSTLSSLALLGSSITYEGRTSTGEIESFTLQEGLLDIYANFATFCQVHSSPQTGNSSESHNTLLCYKLTLARLLVLVYTQPSSGEVDLAIWRLVSQLVAFKHNHQAFDIKLGQILIRWQLQSINGRASNNAVGAQPRILQGAATFVKNNPWKAAGIAGLGVVSVAPMIFLGPVLGAVGFGAAGPIAGTAAAAWQAGIGNVAGGSLFAMCQSAAMGGAALSGGVTTVGATVATVGAGAIVATGRNNGQQESFAYVVDIFVRRVSGAAQLA